MATAFHSTTHVDPMSKHWNQSVPLTAENPPFQTQNMFDHSPYAFSSANNFRMDTAHAEYNPLRDDSRLLRNQRSADLDMISQDDDQAKDASAYQSRRPSVTQSRSATPGRKRSVGAGLNADDVDDSAWIHRDKLAQIESREMAQAGIRVRHTSRHRESNSETRSASRSASRSANRSASRTGNRQPQSQDALSDHTSASMLPPFQETYRNDVPSTRQAVPQHSSDDDTLEYDPAMLQDIPIEKVTNSYNRSMSRPVTSRIPIARASPAPVSSAVVERDSPLPRSTRNRNGSIPLSAVSVEKISYQKTRPRSQSLGSQATMDEAVNPRTPPTTRTRPRSSHFQPSQQTRSAAKDSPSASPPKARNAPKPASSTAGRKVTTNSRNAPRSRNTSAVRKDSPNTRPVSSSATPPVKRPEGEAPWIATMYKPDPRLPQDQQILPTHAKRMLQGQLDKDKRDFSTLDDNDLAKMGAFPDPSPPVEPEVVTEKPQSPTKETPASEPPWPLPSKKSDTTSVRPGSTSGGYRITPTVSLPSASPESRPIPSRAGTRGSVQRVPDIDEKASTKKEKGCACCIVM
ncbi:hypothetical protein BDV97DRAFT_368634 [Delphinella strobiligena]|nr:hypothetical protein BDV97DRAFT_368634 [Delphinella strobiligena]